MGVTQDDEEAVELDGIKAAEQENAIRPIQSWGDVWQGDRQ